MEPRHLEEPSNADISLYISGSLSPALLVDEGPNGGGGPVQVVIPRPPPLIASNLGGGGSGSSSSGSSPVGIISDQISSGSSSSWLSPPWGDGVSWQGGGPYFSAPLESFDGPSVLQWALVAIFIYLSVIFYYDGHNILNSMRNLRGTRECSENSSSTIIRYSIDRVEGDCHGDWPGQPNSISGATSTLSCM